MVACSFDNIAFDITDRDLLYADVCAAKQR